MYCIPYPSQISWYLQIALWCVVEIFAQYYLCRFFEPNLSKQQRLRDRQLLTVRRSEMLPSDVAGDRDGGSSIVVDEWFSCVMSVAAAAKIDVASFLLTLFLSFSCDTDRRVWQSATHCKDKHWILVHLLFFNTLTLQPILEILTSAVQTTNIEITKSNSTFCGI
jgi:hypothetical protein